MNICKVRFNTRTKSLREKFSHKRSYSELSFNNAMGNRLTAETSGSIAGNIDNEHGLSENISNLPMIRPKTMPQDCTGTIHYSSDTFCSTMDITSEPQSSPPINIETSYLPFVWKHDIAIQCDLIKAPKLNWPTATNANAKKFKDGHRKLTQNTSSTLINTLKNFTDTGNETISSGSNRFWKSSTSVSNYQPQNQSKKCASRWTSNVGPTLLKRAASFNDNKFMGNAGGSSSGYSRLVQSNSSPSSPEMLNDEDENKLKVIRPKSFANDTISSETGNLSWWAPITSRGKQTKPTTKSMKDLTISATSVTKSVSKTGKQKRKYLTSRKQQPSSAPDSFDDSTSTITVDINIGNEILLDTTMPTAKSVTTLMASNKLKKISNKPLVKSQHSIEQIDDNFNCKNNAKADNPNQNDNNNNELYSFDIVNRLMNISLQSTQNKTEQKIPSAPFLLNLPDNDSGNSNGYLNLPSPNIQSEIQDVNPVLRKLSVLQRSPERILQIQKRQQMEKKSGKFANSVSCMTIGGDNDFFDDSIDRDNDDNSEDDEELATRNKNRSRRRALVPPKLIADDHSDGDSRESEPNQSQNADLKNNLSDSSSVSPPLPPKPISPDVTVQIIAPDGNVKRNIADNVGNISIPIINQPVDYADDNLAIETNDLKKNLDDNKSDDSTATATMETQHSLCSNNLVPISTANNNNNNNLLNVNTSSNKNRRRSSVVVIPPMQICPGDLLVYSKVLTQRSNLIEGTLAANLVSENQRKSKNSWNLLRLFDRSNRSKMEQLLCGLEEYLANLPISNSFVDETLLEFREISWQEFEARIHQRQQLNMPEEESIESSSESIIHSHQTIVFEECKDRRPSRYGGARFSSFDSMSTTTTIASLPPLANCVHCGNCYSTLSTMQQLENPSDAISRTVYNLGSDKPDDEAYLFEQKMKQKLLLQRTNSVNTESEVESIVDQEMPTIDVYSINDPDPGNVTFSPTNFIDSTNLDGNNEMANVNNLPTIGLCRECRKQKKRFRRQYEALWYLFQSELFFLTNHLMVLKNVFMEPLKNIQVEGYAMFAEPEVLFGNLDELCLLTYAFCKKFLNLLIRFVQQKPEWTDVPGPEPASQAGPANGTVIHVGTILNKLYLKNNRSMSTTQAYHRYTLNYINALQYLETLRRQLEFSEFEKWCNRDPRCKKLQLTDLLVAPVQHIMRVPLLLKEIEAKTIDAIDKKIISDIIDQQELSLRELDDKMRWLKNFERLLEIQRNIIWPSVLDMEPKIFVPEFLKSFVSKQPCERLIASPRRQVILEGSLTIMDSGKPVEMYVFLFDDLILITRRKKSLGKKQSTLTERWVSNCGARTSNFPGTGSTGATCTGSAMAGTVVSSPSPGGTAPGAIGSSPVQPITGSTGQTANPAAGTSSGVVHTGGSGPSTDHLIIMPGEPNPGPLATNVGNACFKYLVYKQPLSLDRFYIHDVPPTDRLKNAFVLVCLNRFQQVVTIHTFQASSEAAKSIWLAKLRTTCERWKHLMHNTNALRTQTANQPGSGTRNQSGSKKKSDQTTKINAKCIKQSQMDGQRNELNKNDEQNVDAQPTEPKRSSLDSLSNVEASVSYQLNDSQMTTSTFT